MGRFVDALLADLDLQRRAHDLQPRTIYFGGGTPTLLSRPHLERLLQGLRDRLPLGELAEWSIEANPMTFDHDKAALMRDMGVTRISLGVQSWQPHLLEELGRDHSPEEAAASYALLRSAGFPVVNIDLMFSLPNQSLEIWQSDLERTLALAPDHLSAYNLTYEEDTPFFDRLGSGHYRDDEENNAEHFYLADRIVTQAGFHHYETSNYARPGKESVHNRAYWAGADYLGLGPSAVSTVEGRRWRNLPHTQIYTERLTPPSGSPESTVVETETLSEADHHNERVALLLRTAAGIPVSLLQPEARQRANELTEEAILQLENDHFSLTPDHRALVDPVAAELFA